MVTGSATNKVWVDKLNLWNCISNKIASEKRRIWIICGDFNEVRCPQERSGSVFSTVGAHNFYNFIDNVSLVGLNLGGQSFTWMRPNGAQFSRLDRFLISSNCLKWWPNVSSPTLPQLHSNYCPILLDTFGLDYAPPPFRFFSSWLLDSGIDEIVKESWDK